MCLLIPDETCKEIKKCEQEIKDAKWMPIDEARKEVSKFNREILDLYHQHTINGFGINKSMVDFVLGGKVSFYSIGKTDSTI